MTASKTSEPVDAAVLASRLADAVVETAVVADGQATWLGPLPGDGQLLESTGDPTLYDGSAGIAFACSAVGRALGRDDVVDIAVHAARHAVTHASTLSSVGLYDGLAGIGIAALVVGTDTERELERAGLELLEVVEHEPPAGPDLISGSAGVALAFLRAAEVTGQERWLAAAAEIGDGLLDRARRHTWGWAWPDGANEIELCGLAHGVAGPAWVLAEVGGRLDDPDRYAAAVRGARQYERSWFDPRTNSWPDLREDSGPVGDERPRPALWCHGSAGIGIGRLGIDRCRHHLAVRAEAAAALQHATATAVSEISTRRLDHGLTVCHGLGGTIELLLDAHAHFGEEERRDEAQWIVDSSVPLLNADAELWPGGINGSPGPGLMNGRAGTMAVLARLAEPGSVPSVARLAVDT